MFVPPNRVGWFASLTLLVSGCGRGAGLGQIGEDEDLVCREAGVDAVGDADLVAVGDQPSVAVSDMLTLATGNFTAPLTWLASGEVVQVELDATALAGTAEVVRYEPASAEIPASACTPRLRFTLQGMLATDDGRLAEDLDALAISDGEQVYVDQRLVGLAGTLDPVALAVGSEPVEADQVDVSLMLHDGLGPFQGQVRPVRVDQPEGDVTPLGTWPGELEGSD